MDSFSLDDDSCSTWERLDGNHSSKSPRIMLIFTSDENGIGIGFSIKLKAVERQPETHYVRYIQENEQVVNQMHISSASLPNMNCVLPAWTFGVPSGFRIKTEFHQFTFEEDKEFLVVGDGEDILKSTELVWLTGDDPPSPVTPPSNASWMLVRHGFERCCRSPIFNATIMAVKIPSVCLSQGEVMNIMYPSNQSMRITRDEAGIVEDKDKTIVCSNSISDENKERYMNYEPGYQIWDFQAPGDFVISVTFSAIKLNFTEDFLYVGSSGLTFMVLNDSCSPWKRIFRSIRFVSPGPSLTIIFNSKTYKVGRGFSAEIQVEKLHRDCTSPTGRSGGSVSNGSVLHPSGSTDVSTPEQIDSLLTSITWKDLILYIMVGVASLSTMIVCVALIRWCHLKSEGRRKAKLQEQNYYETPLTRPELPPRYIHPSSPPLDVDDNTYEAVPNYKEHKHAEAVLKYGDDDSNMGMANVSEINNYTTVPDPLSFNNVDSDYEGIVEGPYSSQKGSDIIDQEAGTSYIQNCDDDTALDDVKYDEEKSVADEVDDLAKGLSDLKGFRSELLTSEDEHLTENRANDITEDEGGYMVPDTAQAVTNNDSAPLSRTRSPREKPLPKEKPKHINNDCHNGREVVSSLKKAGHPRPLDSIFIKKYILPTDNRSAKVSTVQVESLEDCIPNNKREITSGIHDITSISEHDESIAFKPESGNNGNDGVQHTYLDFDASPPPGISRHEFVSIRKNNRQSTKPSHGNANCFPDNVKVPANDAITDLQHTYLDLNDNTGR